MTDTHGAPGGAPESQRTNTAGRKVEAERRNFATPAAASATNLEARPAAPPEAPAEWGGVWRDAFAPLLTAQLEAHRWFDQFWRQAMDLSGTLPSLATGQPLGGLSVAAFGAPAADLRETEAAYLLTVEVPGLRRDDIEVKIEGGALRIAGQKAEEKAEGRADYRVSERRYGRFERSFPIPRDVRREAISATCADGVLKIELPKAEAAEGEARKIEIR